MITLETVRQARDRIRDRVLQTPLVHSPTLSRRFGAQIRLKLENLQKTGSFKIRGATHKLLAQADAIGPNGVVAASAGNHAQGVALAARSAGVDATIVMPTWASISKQEATRSYGGKVVIGGDSVEESLRRAMALADEGRTFIHPFDDPEIIAGQGTIALEILEDGPDTDLIIVPVGGGGLIAGIALAAKSIRPNIRVVGVQAARCPSGRESRRKGQRVRVDAKSSIADGISVKQTGAHPFDLIQTHVDDIVLVDEEDIASAILMLLERKKILAEGAGATPLAALLAGVVPLPAGGRVVLLISGGNVDSPLLGRILNKGLVKNGRIMRLSVQLSDTPGSLARLLDRIADHQANVLHIRHERHLREMPLYTTGVELELETRGADHIETIRADLEGAGYGVRVG